MSNVTLNKGKLAKTVLHEEEILEFILYNRALDNAVANNEIIYKPWSIDKRYQEKSWSTVQKRQCYFVYQHF